MLSLCELFLGRELRLVRLRTLLVEFFLFVRLAVVFLKTSSRLFSGVLLFRPSIVLLLSLRQTFVLQFSISVVRLLSNYLYF